MSDGAVISMPCPRPTALLYPYTRTLRVDCPSPKSVFCAARGYVNEVLPVTYTLRLTVEPDMMSSW